ncbi:hypothetical protein BS78_03G389200 [Paspalum vaginatum]|nr:hypothetical protein BS78_03G389200 [Paspalum vaginatum]
MRRAWLQPPAAAPRGPQPAGRCQGDQRPPTRTSMARMPTSRSTQPACRSSLQAVR